MMTATIPDGKRTPENSCARSRIMAAKSAKMGGIMANSANIDHIVLLRTAGVVGFSRRPGRRA
jgi:hypothetical protein